MKPLLFALALTLALAGCASPYQQALESRVLMRPEPPLTEADRRALAPYDHSPYFSDQRGASSQSSVAAFQGT